MASTLPYAPPAAPLPQLGLSDGLKASDVAAEAIASKWLQSLEQEVKSGSPNLSGLFIDDCFWRDQIALTWDMRTIRGVSAVTKYVAATSSEFSDLKTLAPGGLQPMLLQMGPFSWIQAGFTFGTKNGTGKGCVLLTNTAKDEWKAWIIMTQLQQLKEATGTTNGDQAETNGVQEKNGSSSTSPEHQVIIIGAGQSGLALAAHLKDKGISHLIVDKAETLAAGWHERYESIESHTPSWTDHMPFLRYPTNHPEFQDRVKILKWLNSYAAIMDLNIRLNSRVESTKFDQATRTWHVTVSSNGSTSTLTSHHVVLATGMFTNKPVIPHFPSEDKFRGQLLHSSQHTSAAATPDVAHKRVVVVGSGTSAHDIAEDFARHGCASVTMVQRGPIFSLSRAALTQQALAMFRTPGLALEDADLMSAVFPFQVLRSLSVGQTMAMAQMDREWLDKLSAKGMRIRRGDDGVGIADHQYITGGQFYIDQGAWEMIADGRIGVVACDGGVVDITEQGVQLSDGTALEADIVVLCTGFQRPGWLVEEIMGKDVRMKAGEPGELDEEGERVVWWRPTAVPGFWYMTGNFIWARQYSALLSLQIDAVERGIHADYWKSRENVLDH